MEKTVYPKMLMVRVTPAQHKKLKLAAAEAEVSMSDLVREFIANRLGE